MKTALITGVSSGIGRATAAGMAERGFRIIGAGRSEERTRPVLDEIAGRGGRAEFVHLDLASLRSVAEAVNDLAHQGPIDVLIANAGVGGVTGLTDEGFEVHFGTNHLGHFAFVNGMLKSLPDGARVVVVSSEVHRRADGIPFDDLRSNAGLLRSFSAYGVSKLANVLFARELARREPRIHTYSLHPGVVDTNIFPALTRPFIRNRLTPEQGATTSIWCASADEVSEHTGLYYSRSAERRPSPQALDDDLASELWARSEQWSAGGQ